ncbi:MAG: hypothetical protein EPO65_00790 [Dehalococcoidia bacterium]|nr:MAG: hypothetical protein EPO65_00790 [Dehalococcoidia bacterium]
MTIAAILLAAGASMRMGQPKPLVAWAGRTLLEWELDQLAASCVDEVVVVLGSRAELVRRTLGPRAERLIFNQRWPQGRATSLAKGAASLLAPGRTRPEAVVIQNVDQPALTRVIDSLVSELLERRIDAIQPTYLDATRKAHGGHPVVVASTLLEELTAVTEATEGLRAVLQRHPPLRLAMPNEPSVALDLDTPEALAEGRRVMGT